MATPSRSARSPTTSSPAFLVVDQHAFNEGRGPSAACQLPARAELDRTLAAFDGETMVGVTGIYSFQMRVPGAMAAVAGVSLVAVLPSHRRRGILYRADAAPARRYQRAGRGGGRAVRLRDTHLRAVRLRSRLLAGGLHPVWRRGKDGRRRAGRSRPAAAHRRAAVGPGRAGQGVRAGAGRAARHVRPQRAVVGSPDRQPGPGRRPGAADAVPAGRGRLGPARVRALHHAVPVGPANGSPRWRPRGARGDRPPTPRRPRLAVGRSAQPGPDQRVPRQAAPHRRPAAVPAGRPAPAPAAGHRRPVGPAGGRRRRHGAAALRLPGRRGHRGHRRPVPAERGPLAADRGGRRRPRWLPRHLRADHRTRPTCCCRCRRWAPRISAAPGSAPSPGRAWSPRPAPGPSRCCPPRCPGNRPPGAR